MGALCSRRSSVDNSPDLHLGYSVKEHQNTPLPLCSRDLSELHNRSHCAVLNADHPSIMASALEDFSFESEELQEEEGDADERARSKLRRVLSTKARTAKSRTTLVARKGAAKVNEVGFLIGRAGTASFGKAVEALDTLGSSMTNLNIGSGFTSGAAPKGNKIGILAFEVANTIVKAYNLKQSLSEENMRILKEEILHSEGVQRLVSRDMSELLRIASADKREELKVFSVEVVRFGNHCRDPQWHQLDRIFNKFGTEVTVPRQNKEEALAEMQKLMDLAQLTAELYHEMHALDRFEMDYHRKLQEEEQCDNSQRGESLAILKTDLRSQKKHVKNLKKKSLWSRILEEVMEKLVDIVYFLHQEIQDAFDDADPTGKNLLHAKRSSRDTSSKKLGAAGLSLHYANIINQIDNLVSRPSSVPAGTRDNLYQSLPPSIKTSLRNKISHFPYKELTVPQIKAEMEKILSWLVPVATNTTKAHHGFGWVGEWANTGSALDHRLPGQIEFTLLQTLHHADQRITEEYMLELIIWLQHLITVANSNSAVNKPLVKSPIRSPLQEKKETTLVDKRNATENGEHVSVLPELSAEDKKMLKGVKSRKYMPGISKSQEFDTSKTKCSSNRLSKSSSHSPSTSRDTDFPLPRHVPSTPTNFEIEKMKVLDVIDRVDNI